MLAIKGGQKLIVQFRYEHLPNFCYVCGSLCHQEGGCELAISLMKKGVDRLKHWPYGNQKKAKDVEQGFPVTIDLVEAEIGET